MAYAALVSLSQTIYNLLHDQDQYPISPHEKQQIISMHERIIFFQGFLEDYSDKANSLEGQIRDVANEVEDIIEVFMLEQIRISRLTAGHEGTQVLDLSGMCFDIKNLKRVTKEIESLAEEVMEIKNSARTEVMKLSDSSSVATPSSSRLIIGSTSCKLDNAMVGFEDDLTAIKGRLCGESCELQVIPIYGMGGIGKTTLARNAYDDQLIVEHFEIRAWVTVSQDYGTLKFLTSLVVSIGAQRSKEGDELKIAENIYKSLKGRKYLIVVDDMWSTKAWDDMRKIFPNDNNGSRIILTTRLLDVASYPDLFSPLHQMHFMDANQSWNLLRKKVFSQGNHPPKLEDIGKTIARRCRGLPLAIVVIAGVLSAVSQTQASWETIARNVIEAVTINDDLYFSEIVLSLSYNHLPHRLRPCFLYMGFFPEDYEIPASKLIKLWVAEGFLKLPRGSKSYEEVAEEYLEDLEKRSLVWVTRRKSNGKIKCCSTHDLVRDLCIRKARQEKFLIHVKDSRAFQESVRNQRRVNIAHSSYLKFLKDIYDLHIHTIIHTRTSGYQCEWDCLQSIRLLRVLDVVAELSRFEEFFRLPDVIELFHVRYLALPYQEKILASMSNLMNLQTLIIHKWGKNVASRRIPTICLPMEVWRMRQLRHLVAWYFDGLPNPEAAHFALESLQTLSNVTNFKCTKEILQMIPNLKKLGISYFQDQYVEDYQLQNLHCLHQLEKLTVKTDLFFGMTKSKLKLVYPATLKKLTLICCQLPWEDMRIIGSLPNLDVLKLRTYACDGNEWATCEGEFPRLKFLLIDESLLQHWITESNHFPSLKCLVLRHCIRLEQIPDGIGEIPTLEFIEVDNSNTSLVESAKRIQEEQQENCGNYALQVHIVSYNYKTKKFESY